MVVAVEGEGVDGRAPACTGTSTYPCFLTGVCKDSGEASFSVEAGETCCEAGDLALSCE